MATTQKSQWIPTTLTLEQFEQFILPHLSVGSRGLQMNIRHFRNPQPVASFINEADAYQTTKTSSDVIL